MKNKIKSLEELVEIVKTEKEKNKIIVHCHGCFDCLHFGHIKHFEKAKEQGNTLIVTITPDKYIEKGPGSPFYNQDLRLEFISAIEHVDYVALNKWPTAIETILMLKPNVYAKGKEVLDNKEIDKIAEDPKKISNLEAEKRALEKVGGAFYLTEEITFSSSRIVNRITSAISEESKEYLEKFSKNHNSEKIIKVLDSLKDIKVLVIGDSILDEYVDCQAMEKSGKEALISYKFLESKIHLGGVFAIANHLANFTRNISLITCIGNSTYEFVESSLDRNIERNIFVQKDSKTITKTRHIDSYKGIKIFQIYNTDELKTSEESEEKILRYINNNIQRFDMILIPDFGHGMISQNLIDYFSNSKIFLGISCQLNAGNLGYNFITKYKRADFVSINERELRLPLQEKTCNITVPIIKLSRSLSVNKINITSGKFGCNYYQNGDFFYAPSFTKEPLDTIGAGDAVLSLTSLLAYKDIEPEIIPFLGNCIGGIASRIKGNERAVNKDELEKFIFYTLKY